MRNLTTIIIVVLLIGIAAYVSYYTMKNERAKLQAASAVNPEKPDDLEIIMPKLDPTKGKSLLINAAVGGVLQVKTNQGVIVTLYIPPNALYRSQTITLSPFVEDGNSATLDTGVIITPGTMVLKTPATLSFSLENTSLKNRAPSAINISDGRYFGDSHIYRLIPKRQSITPVLVARATEDSSHIYGRILSGGAYTLSLISSRGEALSRVVLADKNSRPTTILEAASYLIGTSKSLSQKEVKAVYSASKFITSLEQPPLPELYAALALENHLAQKTTFTNTSYIKSACTNPGSSHIEYISGAAAATALRDTNEADTCIQTAKSTQPLIINTEMEPIIKNATPSAQEISTQTDILNQDAYTVIQIDEEEGTFNSILEDIQDPTPTQPDFSESELKF